MGERGRAFPSAPSSGLPPSVRSPLSPERSPSSDKAGDILLMILLANVVMFISLNSRHYSNHVS